MEKAENHAWWFMPKVLALRGRGIWMTTHLRSPWDRLPRPHCELLSLKKINKTKKLLSGFLEVRGQLSTGHLRMLQRSADLMASAQNFLCSRDFSVQGYPLSSYWLRALLMSEPWCSQDRLKGGLDWKLQALSLL